jgi:hypothetical protein
MEVTMTSRDERIDKYCDGEDYKNWMDIVDRLITNELGFGAFDLPDRRISWEDMFNDGWTPEEAAQEAIQNPWDN